jgi:hypothetical protein
MHHKQKNPADEGEALNCLAWPLDGPEYSTAPNGCKDLLHHEHQVARLHALGPRPLFEMLAEIARSTGQPALIADHVAKYARLDPEIVRAIGADHFPPNVLGVVR